MKMFSRWSSPLEIVTLRVVPLTVSLSCVTWKKIRGKINWRAKSWRREACAAHNGLLQRGTTRSHITCFIVTSPWLTLITMTLKKYNSLRSCWHFDLRSSFKTNRNYQTFGDWHHLRYVKRRKESRKYWTRGGKTHVILICIIFRMKVQPRSRRNPRKRKPKEKRRRNIRNTRNMAAQNTNISVQNTRNIRKKTSHLE